MAKILRGDIIWPDLNPTKGHEQSGKRPILILSHDVFNEKSGTVIGVALTTQPQKANFPLTLALGDKIDHRNVWVKTDLPEANCRKALVLKGFWRF